MNLSKQEVWELLEALYKHGVHYEAVHTDLPQWGVDSLKILVRRFKTSSERLQRKKKEAPTDDVDSMSKWAAHVENIHILEGTQNKDLKGTRSHGRLPVTVPKNHTPLLSKIMLYLSEREEHPPPSSKTDPDYREIYRYLSQVLAGEEPSQMSQGSAAKVIEMLTKIKGVAQKSRHKGMVNHYVKLHNKPLFTYSNKISSKSIPVKTKGKRKVEEEEEEEDSTCSLFCVPDIEEKDIELIDLKKEDIHYDFKKQKAEEKCKKKQTDMASKLVDVPGMNPLNFPVHLLAQGLVTPLGILP